MNKQTKILSNISLLAFAFVILVVIISLITTNHYGRSNTEVAQMLQQEYLVGHEQLVDILQGKQEGYFLIDLRGEEQYQVEHIAGAVNIPFHLLLEKNNLKRLNSAKGRIPVLYAGKESVAHSALYLLLSAGLKTKPLVLPGNFPLEDKLITQESSLTNVSQEAARHEYKLFLNADPAAVSPAKAIVPKMQTPATNVKGGC